MEAEPVIHIDLCLILVFPTLVVTPVGFEGQGGTVGLGCLGPNELFNFERGEVESKVMDQFSIVTRIEWVTHLLELPSEFWRMRNTLNVDQSLRTKDIGLVKVQWERLSGSAWTWEPEAERRSTIRGYSMFKRFRGRNLDKWGRVVLKHLHVLFVKCVMSDSTIRDLSCKLKFWVGVKSWIDDHRIIDWHEWVLHALDVTVGHYAKSYPKRVKDAEYFEKKGEGKGADGRRGDLGMHRRELG
ncbi:hypothetical protein OSB04_023646 [Centaurea solstitialis]|uniref:Uncharacterized protein n=1 Tax=Centaurea solstitialis TaxID=347529 RepID=A0AA38SLB7_9ASTR|nr:hypothetical protein OSB04_023646 [Centaurea solstitialis]